MSIYSILTSIDHNAHYLNRYYNFVTHVKSLGRDPEGNERHHILPKSMWPEYTSLTENEWNGVWMTPREHFLAHWMLWKAYRNHSMAYAFNIMSNRFQNKKSRAYQEVVDYHREYMGDYWREKVERGEHHFQSDEFKELRRETAIKSNRIKLEDGTHHFLCPVFREKHNQYLKSLADKGQLHIQSDEFKQIQSERVKAYAAKGLHNSQQEYHKKINSEKQKQLAAEGKHHSQSTKFKEKHSNRLNKETEQGAHPWQSDAVRDKIRKSTQSKNKRPEVLELKEIKKQLGEAFRLPRGWNMKDQVYLETLLKEGRELLLSLHLS